MPLRLRVLLLTTAFALVLFAITFGLSWRARRTQERWSRLIAVETEAIAALEELIRAQNAFRTRFAPDDPQAATRYRAVAQLMQKPALGKIDAMRVRSRVNAFAKTIEATQVEWQAASPQAREQIVADFDEAALRVIAEAQALVDARKREIARQLPLLERDSRDMMSAGLAIAWILVLVSFAVVQTTLRKVVKPIEDLSRAADRIAAGDVTARAPVGGDREIATLGVAFNRMADELRARARTDDLTGLPNFRAFRERIDGEIDRAARYPERFGILVLDLDRFKKYNDTFGHLAGNEALQRVSRVLRDTVRSVDFPARYGGEEFAVIVPQIEPSTLSMIAERIRANVEALPAPPGGAQITTSIGAAIYPDDGANAEALFHAADERLYEAKAAGRNKVIVPTAVAVKRVASRE